MNRQVRKKLAAAVDRWARSHPSPDRVVMRLLGKKAATPAEIAEGVRLGTPLGILFLDVLENEVRASSLEKVLVELKHGSAGTRSAAHGG